jgi:mandelate racemase
MFRVAARRGAARPRRSSSGLQGRLRLLGAQGLAMLALSALDMAAWDAVGAQRRRPAGAAARRRAIDRRPPTTAAGSGWSAPRRRRRRRSRSRRLRGDQAAARLPDARRGLAVLRAVRARSPHGCRILVDYNQCLTVAEGARAQPPRSTRRASLDRGADRVRR